MIDRLNDVLQYLEHLPPEAQEEAASYIEALAEAFERKAFVAGRTRRVPSEIQPVEDQLRHANPPTPPLEHL